MATPGPWYTPPPATVVGGGVAVVLGVVGVLGHGVAGGVQAVVSTDMIARHGAVRLTGAGTLQLVTTLDTRLGLQCQTLV